MKLNKKHIFYIIILYYAFCFINCGLDEYDYLPKVPDANIQFTSGNTNATVILPEIKASDYPYADRYAIFYRIYLSDHNTDAQIVTPNDRRSVSTQLQSDFSTLDVFASTTNASVPNSNTFRNLNYYEMKMIPSNVLSIPAGEMTLTIDFNPSEAATITANLPGVFPFAPERYTIGFSPKPETNRTFRFFDDLRDNTKASNNTGAANTNPDNRDVYRNAASGLADFVYVSMYVVAIGYNSTTTFSEFFGKPTHIGVFRIQ